MRTTPLTEASGAIEEADSEGNPSTPALSKQVCIGRLNYKRFGMST